MEIIIAVISVIGGGVGLHFIKKWWPTSADIADAHTKQLANEHAMLGMTVSQTGTYQTLMAKVKETVEESLAQAQKNQELQTDLMGQKLLVKIRDEQITEANHMMKTILIEQGAIREREDQCQKNLAEFKLRLDEALGFKKHNEQLTNANLTNMAERQNELQDSDS